MESGVHSSLSGTCHHEVVFAKLNLKTIDWEERFANIKPVESQVSELNNLLLNIYSNYIPNKTVLCDAKDPPWMANGFRAVIEMKSNAYKEYIRSGMRHNYYVRLENLTTELSNLIRDTKTEYDSKLAAKLLNPSTSAKIYWLILKNFVYGIEVPVITPLLINNEFIFNFKAKANYFNRFFNQQCTAFSSDSSIPSSLNLATNETVTKISFDEQLIPKLIVALNHNKAHCHDGLSIRISKPLSIIFRNCLKAGYFQAAWKKANVVTVHKKRKQANSE